MRALPKFTVFMELKLLGVGFAPLVYAQSPQESFEATQRVIALTGLVFFLVVVVSTLVLQLWRRKTEF